VLAAQTGISHEEWPGCIQGVSVSIADDFEEFWTHYPRRVGKLAADRAYRTARKQATGEAIMAGLLAARFARDPQFIPHPSTWLNQGRWMDEDVPAVKKKHECPHTPRCNSKEWCLTLIWKTEQSA
jgi:hypothetical protein